MAARKERPARNFASRKMKHNLKISDLRALSMEKSAFFYHDQMRERGDKMSNFRLNKRTVELETDLGLIECYALHRRFVVQGAEKTVYISVKDLLVVEGRLVI
jgi:hypothetical protein